jgi:hypothetical protein
VNQDVDTSSTTSVTGRQGKEAMQRCHDVPSNIRDLNRWNRQDIYQKDSNLVLDRSRGGDLHGEKHH